jgi:hypothetical protein
LFLHLVYQAASCSASTGLLLQKYWENTGYLLSSLVQFAYSSYSFQHMRLHEGKMEQRPAMGALLPQWAYQNCNDRIHNNPNTSRRLTSDAHFALAGGQVWQSGRDSDPGFSCLDRQVNVGVAQPSTLGLDVNGDHAYEF